MTLHVRCTFLIGTFRDCRSAKQERVRQMIKSWLSEFPANRGPFSFVFAELTGGTKRDLCHGSKLPLIRPPSIVVDGGFRNACSLKAKDNLPPPKIFRAADFLWNARGLVSKETVVLRRWGRETQNFAPALLRVYGRVNYTFDCKFVSKSLFNWGILHIPYSSRKSFEKRAQFASPNALQNNLHIERNRLRVASLEERIERVWSSETSKDVF